MKKFFLLLFLFFLFGFAYSQTTAELKQKKSIDYYSDAIEKDKSVKKYKFTVIGSDKNILYKYEKKSNEIVKISRNWDEKDGDYKATYSYDFVMKNESKIYAQEGITYQNYNDSEDISIWNVKFWLKNDKVIFTTSLGHGKTEMDDWDYEKELKENFNYMLKTVKNYDNKRMLIEKK
ncbi:hypothetical protein [Frigoriflavimonas asaccharolytica]|uniref:DUF4468 domain-containing protein n=1 Tax=Frigoriflavimonas asaccharolytica TaxID=2735899 RepID=A0A8J8G5J1_9FLAO|nr:hypothetical protein [Frigoriflavimonas asaccharolytica]NRS91130.1 hypothetical protein [Frigoriflavimonas asaccharolytica]